MMLQFHIKIRRINRVIIDSTAILRFVVILVDLNNTANSISTNIETAVLPSYIWHCNKPPLTIFASDCCWVRQWRCEGIFHALPAILVVFFAIEGVGPEKDGLVLGDQRGQRGLWCRVGQKRHQGLGIFFSSKYHQVRIFFPSNLHQINKLAAVTLEGGLHVWDCSTLSQEGQLAQVKSSHYHRILVVLKSSSIGLFHP